MSDPWRPSQQTLFTMAQKTEAVCGVPAESLLRVGGRTLRRWSETYRLEPNKPSTIPYTTYAVWIYALDGECVLPQSISEEKSSLIYWYAKYEGARDLSRLVGEDALLGMTFNELANTLKTSEYNLRKMVFSERGKGAHHVLWCAILLMAGLDVDVKTGNVL